MNSVYPYFLKLPPVHFLFFRGSYLLVCPTRPWCHASHLCVFPLPTHAHKVVCFLCSCKCLISSTNAHMQMLPAAKLTGFTIQLNISVIVCFIKTWFLLCAKMLFLPTSLRLPSPSSLLSSHSPLLFLSESRLIGRQTSWPSPPPPPGPSINHTSLYSPPLIPSSFPPSQLRL